MSAGSTSRRWIEFDKDGVAILGECLRRWANNSESYHHLGEIKYLTGRLNPDVAPISYPLDELRGLDFWFRWDHYLNFKTLIGFVKPGLPIEWDQETPIVLRAASDPLPGLLLKIFHSECSRLLGPEPQLVSDPKNHDEEMFFLTVCEFCTPPQRGAPPRQRWQDGRTEAACEVARLRHDASACDKEFVLEAAIRGVLMKYEIVSADKFNSLSQYQKRRSIVANSQEAAQAAVRGRVPEIPASDVPEWLARDLIQERDAIQEYDGDLSRADAQREAVKGLDR
ncbi:hypothetical protein SAMN06265173_101197 [Thalassovita litoralis]|uniref:Uncharacterized protein n=1 Tax=Thalassovita litoralis TaxID=1010611 RepID=A0A521AJG5_9RHOB|nr:hypothetical protein [Thalassovita litoralis]SMO34911.1 hypothetical protein SAMN06265173_101197 [Thalassovita litoralis]